jgi:hypothetical protein
VCTYNKMESMPKLVDYDDSSDDDCDYDSIPVPGEVKQQPETVPALEPKLEVPNPVQDSINDSLQTALHAAGIDFSQLVFGPTQEQTGIWYLLVPIQPINVPPPPPPSKKKRDPKTYKCTECNYQTVDKNKFQRHEANHASNRKLYKCTECSYVAFGNHVVTAHMNKSHGISIAKKKKK